MRLSIRRHSGLCSLKRIRSLSLPRLFVLTQRLLCFDNLALRDAQSHNPSCGEERADAEEDKKKKQQLAAGPIDRQSRSCDLFTAVSYVEAREGGRKSLLI